MKGRAALRADTQSTTMGITSSVVLHLLGVTLFLIVIPKPVISPPVYAVELVAAPLPTSVARAAPEAVTRPPEPAPPTEAPAPAPAKPAKAEAVKPKAKPEKAPPAPAKPVATEKPVEKAPVTKSEAKPLPGETPGTGNDVANIKIPGIEFPFPDYLRNIMNEVLRRWSAPNNKLRAEVAFLILKDGSVRDIRFLTRSGNFSFDLEAQGAIESCRQQQGIRPPSGWMGRERPSGHLCVRAAAVRAVHRAAIMTVLALAVAGRPAAAQDSVPQQRGRAPDAALRSRQSSVAVDGARRRLRLGARHPEARPRFQ